MSLNSSTFVVLSVLLAILSITCSVHGEMSVSRFTPFQMVNLFTAKERNAQACSCATCTCAGNTCPFSISALTSLDRSVYCSTANSYMNSYSVNVASTDGSAYDVYTVTETEYNKYKSGMAFQYYSALSSQSVTCLQMSSNLYDLTVGKLYTVIKCKNLIMSCPTKYEVTGSCVSIGDLTLYLPSSVKSGEQFSASIGWTGSNSVTVSLSSFLALSGTTTMLVSPGTTTMSGLSFTTSSDTTLSVIASTIYGGKNIEASSTMTVSAATSPSNPGTATDYTSYWVGTWQVVPQCDQTSCCCLDGNVQVSKMATNSVQVQSPVKGQCGSYTQYVFSVDNINSATSISTTLAGNTFTLTRSGLDLTVTNQNAASCSGKATCTSGSCLNRSNSATRMYVSMVGIVIGFAAFLFM